MSREQTKKNVALLAVCQALGMSSLALSMTITALVGSRLAEDPSVATMPLALQFMATMLTTIPASLFMRRFGRRTGFSIGAAIGLAGGLISAKAVAMESYTGLCAGAFLLGVFAAHVAYYRFAAADTASDAFRSRAISLVLAGGIVAAFLGPELAKWTRDIFPEAIFAGGYVSISILAAISLVLLQFIKIPGLSHAEQRLSGRPLVEIARQPAFFVAALCAMIGYGAMNLIMVATPLAMVAHHHPFETAAFVIQWHVVGMYAPSFFTGHLIHRFGVISILFFGAMLILCCVAVNMTGAETYQFWFALVMLGLGWNFMFIGGTTLLTEAYRPEEKAKVQAFNDFLVFGTTTVTAFSSGALYGLLGWRAVNLGVVLPMILALLAIIWLGRRRAAVVT